MLNLDTSLEKATYLADVLLFHQTPHAKAHVMQTIRSNGALLLRDSLLNPRFPCDMLCEISTVSFDTECRNTFPSHTDKLLQDLDAYK